MGGSIGKNKGSSSSSNQFNQSVFGPQAEALQGLWKSAQQNLFQDFMPQITGAAQNAFDKMNNAFQSASGVQGQLAQGGAFGDTSDVRQRLMDMMGQRSNVGSMYESIVGGPGNTYVDPLINSLRSDAAQNLQTLQGGNALDAAAMGQSGSSRHAMENAMLGAQANKDLMAQESALRAGAYDKDLSMKMDIARQADTNRQSEQDRLYNMLAGKQGSLESAQQGSGLMQALAMGGMAPWLQTQQAAWNPFNNLANIIGAPTILGSGSGSGSGKSKGFGMGGGLWG